MPIEPFQPEQLDAVIRLSLRAWAPVFDSIEQAMDADVYREMHPDWRATQKQAVEDVCSASDANVWVAIESGSVAGFVAVKLHPQERLGEIYMIAVDPEHQGRGIGAALTEFALDWIKRAGVPIAMVETGGDAGHAPARRLYERAGFGLLPIARYFKKL